MENIQETNNYQRYLELDGIINEKDYTNALKRANSATELNETLLKQGENIAKFASIELSSIGEAVDPRIILYGILRRDTRPKGVRYHHDQMSDQRIFVEALRMLGDIESMEKMIEKHPHISFKYQRGANEEMITPNSQK